MWQIKFKVKDKTLYGKEKSIVSNINVEIPSWPHQEFMLSGVFQQIAEECKRLSKVPLES